MILQERLLGALQAAIVDDAAWPDFLVEFSHQLGATEVALGGGQPGRDSIMYAPHTDASFIGTYNEIHHQQNALMHAVLRRPAGALTVTDSMPEHEAFSRSDFYNLWCVPNEFNYGLALSLGTSTGWVGALVVNTRHQSTEAQVDQLRALAPQLQHAVELWRMLAPLRSASRLTLSTLDIAGMGALFLDRAGRVLEFNDTAQEMLDDGRLTLQGRQLYSADPRSSRQLATLIARCQQHPEGSGGRLQLASKTGPLQLQCAPFPAGMAFPAQRRPCVIVLVTDPQQKMRERLATLRKLHGLTQAESEMALAVVQTGSRKAAAAVRGVSDSTARTQLTSIFDKTGIRRQTELVRLVMDEI